MTRMDKAQWGRCLWLCDHEGAGPSNGAWSSENAFPVGSPKLGSRHLVLALSGMVYNIPAHPLFMSEGPDSSDNHRHDPRGRVGSLGPAGQGV